MPISSIKRSTFPTGNTNVVCVIPHATNQTQIGLAFGLNKSFPHVHSSLTEVCAFIFIYIYINN